MVRPVNPALPPIYTLSSAPRLKLVRKGNLCVYKMVQGEGVTFSHYETVQAKPQVSLV